jgi:hypothetical protein
MRPVLALALAAGFATAAGQADSGVAPPGPATASPGFSAEEVKAAVEAHIRARSAADDGVYQLADDRTGGELPLIFLAVGMVGSDALWRIHNPARQAAAGDAFACATFRAASGPPGQIYDVDMLLTRRDGRLEVREAFVHKEPRLVGGKWVKVERPPRP